MVDYGAISQYLLTPLVEFPEELSIDCEATASGRYVLVRVAVAEADRERVIGKNGRTIAMIRTILAIAGQRVGQAVDINLYTEQGEASPRKSRRNRSRS